MRYRVIEFSDSQRNKFFRVEFKAWFWLVWIYARNTDFKPKEYYTLKEAIAFIEEEIDSKLFRNCFRNRIKIRVHDYKAKQRPEEK